MKDMLEFLYPWVGTFCVSAVMFGCLMLWEEYGQQSVWLNNFFLPGIGLTLLVLTIYHACHKED